MTFGKTTWKRMLGSFEDECEQNIVEYKFTKED